MRGSFSCTNCGNALKLDGLTPNRKVRCEACQQWVEVPFLPRAGGKKRGIVMPVSPQARSRSKWNPWLLAALGGGGLVTILLVVLVWNLMLQSRARHVQERALAQLISAAQQEERERNYGAAVGTIDNALAEIAKVEPRDEARLEQLRTWRTRIARRELQDQLAAVARMTPDQAVPAYRSILARIQSEPTLQSYQDSIHERIDLASESWAEADLKAARIAADSGNAARAIELCERLVGNTNSLGTERRRRARAEADVIVSRIISQRGVLLGAIHGQYLEGSATTYTSLLGALIADTIRQHGYIARPTPSFWDPVWDQQAPYRMEVTVVERFVGTYPQTASRLSAIEIGLFLEQKGQKKPIWEGRVSSRTRVPLPKLVVERPGKPKLLRDPALEHLFYEDARGLLAERFTQQLRTFPDIRLPQAPAPLAPAATAGPS